jgi:uncharacterized protein (DUF1778 family)
LKNEEEKIKTRANIGANDADWATIRQAVVLTGKEQSIFLREAAIQKARSVLARKGVK